MTWADDTPSFVPSWAESTSTSLTWNDVPDASPDGNFSRFVDADPLDDGTGGIDYNNTISSENPWVVTSTNPIALTSTRRENPV